MNPGRIILVSLIVLLLGATVAGFYFGGAYGMLVPVVALGLLLLLDKLWGDEAVVRRTLRKAPAATIDELGPGQRVKLVGTLRIEGEPLTAPLSGRPCAVYVARVGYRWRRAGERGEGVAVEEQRGSTFRLVDETGETLVRAEGARVALVHDFAHDVLRGEVLYRQTPEPPELAPRADALLMAHGKSLDAIEAETGAIHFPAEEGVLADGDRVAVLGTVTRAEGSGERSAPRALVMTGTEEAPLFISNVPDALHAAPNA